MSNNQLTTTKATKQNEILTTFKSIMDEWFKNNDIEIKIIEPCKVPSKTPYADVKCDLLLSSASTRTPWAVRGDKDELTVKVAKNRKPSKHVGGKYVLYDIQPCFEENE